MLARARTPAIRRVRSCSPFHTTCRGILPVALAEHAPNRIDRRPPALRATGIALRIRTAVSLPSIARSMRNHVDAGRRRSAVRRHVDEIDHHQRADAGLHDQVERLDGAIDHALHERARARSPRARPVATPDRSPPRFSRRPARAPTTAATTQCRTRAPWADRNGRMYRSAPRIRRVAWQRPAPPRRDSFARTRMVPPLPTPGLAAVHRTAHDPGCQSRKPQPRRRPDVRAT